MANLPKWTTACPDWERRIVAREPIIPGRPLFPAQAEWALGIFGELVVADAIGSPPIKDIARPWVMDFVAAIFGALDPHTGRRLINEFLLLISKKNGKSTIAAGIMLTALIMNERQSGEFIILAPTKEIADNSYIPIRDMIKLDPELSEMFRVQDYFRTVTHLGTGSTLKVVAADTDTVSGKKAIGVFVDELWVFGKRANAAAMLREATGGLASRPEGFVIYATTQSDDPPAGVFKQKLDYARKVRDGKHVDPRFMPVLYEFPAAMVKAGAHRDLQNAYVTNPNWGASVDVPFIEGKYQQAIEEGEGEVRGFLAKHLNVEIGLNLRSDRWAGADYWLKRIDETLTLETLLARSEVVTVGIDGGGLDDLLGLAVLGRERRTRRWLHWGMAWAHQIVLERRKEIAPQLLDYDKAGHLKIVDLPGDDIEELAAIVCRIRDLGLLPEKFAVGVDDAGIKDIIKALMAPEHGITYEQIARVRQGYSLNGTIKTTERALAGGTLVHSGQPIMAWAVSNARIEDRGNAILVTKAASGKAKIDPVMALFDAVEMMALEPVAAASIDDFLSHTLSA